MFTRGKKRSRESLKDRASSARGKKPRLVPSEEEARLERLLFGDTSNITASASNDDVLDVDIDEPVSSSHGSHPSQNDDSGVDEGGISPSSAEECGGAHKEPAWMDEDDDGIAMQDAFALQGRSLQSGGEAEYSSILKQKYEAIIGKPRWAELGSPSHSQQTQSDDDSDAEEMLQHCGGYLSRHGGRSLPKTTLEYKGLKNLNIDTRAEGHIIKSVEFHPSSTVALVAGMNGTVSIVQVDGKVNTKLQTMNFDRFPIHCAHFSQCGNQFYIGSADHGHYYVHDMVVGRSLRVPISHHSEITQMKKFVISPDGRILAVQGRFGNLHLVSTHTNEWIGSLKMNGDVRSFAFNNSGSRLYSHGDSEVYIWDVKARSCVHRFTDDGCLKGTSIALSPNERYLACGSSSGVVNVYDASTLSHSVSPVPLKTVLNLTTPINNLKFNASSEVLAMSSRHKDNALKMLHSPSMTVFSNFPPRNDNFYRVDTLDFSPHSGFFALGNNRGSALLFRLKHFGNY